MNKGLNFEPQHGRTSRPRLRVLSPPPRNDDAVEIQLSFRQLVLIRRSLEAVRTLDVYPPQDELLGDTTHLVDLALKKAV